MTKTMKWKTPAVLLLAVFLLSVANNDAPSSLTDAVWMNAVGLATFLTAAASIRTGPARALALITTSLRLRESQ